MGRPPIRSSWPGKRREAPSSRLKSRPSTPSTPRLQDVDARHKAGHDGIGALVVSSRQPSPFPRGVFPAGWVFLPLAFPSPGAWSCPLRGGFARRSAGAGRRFGACPRNCTGDLCFLWAPSGAPHVAISDSGTALFVSRPLVAASPSASSSRAVLMPPGGDPKPPGTAGPLGPPARAPHPLPVVRCGTGHGLLGGSGWNISLVCGNGQARRYYF